jgi:hypothetical protein
MPTGHAVVFERNRLVNRRISRLLSCAGVPVTAVEEPEQARASISEATTLLCCDGFDIDLALALLKQHPQLRALLWTAEPVDRLLKYTLEEPRMSNIMGRPNFESTPRDWELGQMARRLVDPSSGRPSWASLLHWSHTAIELRPASTRDRDLATQHTMSFVERIGVPKRVAEMFGELAHEVLMNAIYDAPADANGKAKYAADRKAEVQLQPHEVPTMILGTDGVRLVMNAWDPFGRLKRQHVFGGLLRGLKGGEMDTSHGGAGLGMTKLYQSVNVMTFDVEPGKRTEFRGVFELDMNLREFKSLSKSVHFFLHE